MSMVKGFTVDAELLARLHAYVEQIKKDTGLDVSLSEAIRALLRAGLRELHPADEG